MLQLGILCHEVKPPVPGMGFILLSCCPKEPHRNLQTSWAIAKAFGCSSQSGSKALLLKTALT